MLIDGSFGEGGGQILRTSLAMSILTNTPIRLENVRGGRKKPGLLRQHLTGVRAAQAICGAKVQGDTLKSQTVEFSPGAVRGGDYAFNIGSAGSAMLVLQTVLPPLMFADAPSTVTLEGGTHNPMSPPFDFLQTSFVPALTKMGAQVELTLVRPGFFPAGGGKVIMKVQPVAKLAPLSLMGAGDCAVSGQVLIAHLPEHVADREVQELQKQLELPEEAVTRQVNQSSKGPGNVVMVTCERETHTELFTGFGEKGLRAEMLVERLAQEVQSFLKADVAVGEHLADQLLIPMALGQGGEFSTVPLSKHTTTNMEMLKRFLNVKFEVESGDERAVVRVEAGAQ